MNRSRQKYTIDLFQRCTAIILLLTFLCQNLVWAQGGMMSFQPSSQNADKLMRSSQIEEVTRQASLIEVARAIYEMHGFAKDGVRVHSAMELEEIVTRLNASFGTTSVHSEFIAELAGVRLERGLLYIRLQQRKEEIRMFPEQGTDDGRYEIVAEYDAGIDGWQVQVVRERSQEAEAIDISTRLLKWLLDFFDLLRRLLAWFVDFSRVRSIDEGSIADLEREAEINRWQEFFARNADLFQTGNTLYYQGRLAEVAQEPDFTSAAGDIFTFAVRDQESGEITVFRGSNPSCWADLAAIPPEEQTGDIIDEMEDITPLFGAERRGMRRIIDDPTRTIIRPHYLDSTEWVATDSKEIQGCVSYQGGVYPIAEVREGTLVLRSNTSAEEILVTGAALAEVIFLRELSPGVSLSNVNFHLEIARVKYLLDYYKREIKEQNDRMARLPLRDLWQRERLIVELESLEVMVAGLEDYQVTLERLMFLHELVWDPEAVLLVREYPEWQEVISKSEYDSLAYEYPAGHPSSRYQPATRRMVRQISTHRETRDFGHGCTLQCLGARLDFYEGALRELNNDVMENLEIETVAGEIDIDNSLLLTKLNRRQPLNTREMEQQLTECLEEGMGDSELLAELSETTDEVPPAAVMVARRLREMDDPLLRQLNIESLAEDNIFALVFDILFPQRILRALNELQDYLESLPLPQPGECLDEDTLAMITSLLTVLREKDNDPLYDWAAGRLEVLQNSTQRTLAAALPEIRRRTASGSARYQFHERRGPRVNGRSLAYRDELAELTEQETEINFYRRMLVRIYREHYFMRDVGRIQRAEQMMSQVQPDSLDPFQLILMGLTADLEAQTVYELGVLLGMYEEESVPSNADLAAEAHYLTTLHATLTEGTTPLERELPETRELLSAIEQRLWRVDSIVPAGFDADGNPLGDGDFALMQGIANNRRLQVAALVSYIVPIVGSAVAAGIASFERDAKKARLEAKAHDLARHWFQTTEMLADEIVDAKGVPDAAKKYILANLAAIKNDIKNAMMGNLPDLPEFKKKLAELKKRIKEYREEKARKEAQARAKKRKKQQQEEGETQEDETAAAEAAPSVVELDAKRMADALLVEAQVEAVKKSEKLIKPNTPQTIPELRQRFIERIEQLKKDTQTQFAQGRFKGRGIKDLEKKQKGFAKALAGIDAGKLFDAVLTTLNPAKNPRDPDRLRIIANVNISYYFIQAWGLDSNQVMHAGTNKVSSEERRTFLNFPFLQNEVHLTYILIHEMLHAMWEADGPPEIYPEGPVVLVSHRVMQTLGYSYYYGEYLSEMLTAEIFGELEPALYMQLVRGEKSLADFLASPKFKKLSSQQQQELAVLLKGKDPDLAKLNTLLANIINWRQLIEKQQEPIFLTQVLLTERAYRLKFFHSNPQENKRIAREVLLKTLVPALKKHLQKRLKGTLDPYTLAALAILAHELLTSAEKAMIEALLRSFDPKLGLPPILQKLPQSIAGSADGFTIPLDGPRDGITPDFFDRKAQQGSPSGLFDWLLGGGSSTNLPPGVKSWQGKKKAKAAAKEAKTAQPVPLKKYRSMEEEYQDRVYNLPYIGDAGKQKLAELKIAAQVLKKWYQVMRSQPPGAARQKMAQDVLTFMQLHFYAETYEWPKISRIYSPLLKIISEQLLAVEFDVATLNDNNVGKFIQLINFNYLSISDIILIGLLERFAVLLQKERTSYLAMVWRRMESFWDMRSGALGRADIFSLAKEFNATKLFDLPLDYLSRSVLLGQQIYPLHGYGIAQMVNDPVKRKQLSEKFVKGMPLITALGLVKFDAENKAQFSGSFFQEKGTEILSLLGDGMVAAQAYPYLRACLVVAAAIVLGKNQRPKTHEAELALFQKGVALFFKIMKTIPEEPPVKVKGKLIPLFWCLLAYTVLFVEDADYEVYGEDNVPEEISKVQKELYRLWRKVPQDLNELEKHLDYFFGIDDELDNSYIWRSTPLCYAVLDIIGVQAELYAQKILSGGYADQLTGKKKLPRWPGGARDAVSVMKRLARGLAVNYPDYAVAKKKPVNKLMLKLIGHWPESSAEEIRAKLEMLFDLYGVKGRVGALVPVVDQELVRLFAKYNKAKQGKSWPGAVVATLTQYLRIDVHYKDDDIARNNFFIRQFRGAAAVPQDVSDLLYSYLLNIDKEQRKEYLGKLYHLLDIENRAGKRMAVNELSGFYDSYYEYLPENRKPRLRALMLARLQRPFPQGYEDDEYMSLRSLYCSLAAEEPAPALISYARRLMRTTVRKTAAMYRKALSPDVGVEPWGTDLEGYYRLLLQSGDKGILADFQTIFAVVINAAREKNKKKYQQVAWAEGFPESNRWVPLIIFFPEFMSGKDKVDVLRWILNLVNDERYHYVYIYWLLLCNKNGEDLLEKGMFDQAALNAFLERQVEKWEKVWSEEGKEIRDYYDEFEEQPVTILPADCNRALQLAVHADNPALQQKLVYYTLTMPYPRKEVGVKDRKQLNELTIQLVQKIEEGEKKDKQDKKGFKYGTLLEMFAGPDRKIYIDKKDIAIYEKVFAKVAANAQKHITDLTAKQLQGLFVFARKLGRPELIYRSLALAGRFIAQAQQKQAKRQIPWELDLAMKMLREAPDIFNGLDKLKKDMSGKEFDALTAEDRADITRLGVLVYKTDAYVRAGTLADLGIKPLSAEDSGALLQRLVTAAGNTDDDALKVSIITAPLPLNGRVSAAEALKIKGILAPLTGGLDPADAAALAEAIVVGLNGSRFGLNKRHLAYAIAADLAKRHNKNNISLSGYYAVAENSLWAAAHELLAFVTQPQETRSPALRKSVPRIAAYAESLTRDNPRLLTELMLHSLRRSDANLMKRLIASLPEKDDFIECWQEHDVAKKVLQAEAGRLLIRRSNIAEVTTESKMKIDKSYLRRMFREKMGLEVKNLDYDLVSRDYLDSLRRELTGLGIGGKALERITSHIRRTCGFASSAESQINLNLKFLTGLIARLDAVLSDKGERGTEELDKLRRQAIRKWLRRVLFHEAIEVRLRHNYSAQLLTRRAPAVLAKINQVSPDIIPEFCRAFQMEDQLPDEIFREFSAKYFSYLFDGQDSDLGHLFKDNRSGMAAVKDILAEEFKDMGFGELLAVLNEDYANEKNKTQVLRRVLRGPTGERIRVVRQETEVPVFNLKSKVGKSSGKLARIPLAAESTGTVDISL